MISIRDGVDRPSEPADLANASAQSTHPLLWICQVLLSMVLSRHRSPVGETTSMEPVLRSASLDTCNRGTGPESRDLFVMKARATQSVRNPKAKNARGRSARNRPMADGFRAGKVPVARMLHQFVAAVHGAELSYRLACRAMMSGNHCAFVSENGKRPHRGAFFFCDSDHLRSRFVSASGQRSGRYAKRMHRNIGSWSRYHSLRARPRWVAGASGRGSAFIRLKAGRPP
jgi:hypothetical protein